MFLLLHRDGSSQRCRRMRLEVERLANTIESISVRFTRNQGPALEAGGGIGDSK
jgi:hypothetical protein